MPENNRKLRVFLCHASQDKLIVRELYERLLAAPYGDDKSWIDPWLDEEKLLPGHDWSMEIEKAVEAADVVIVCLSNTSVSKEGYVQRELRFVLDIALEKPEGTIFVVPLRLNDCELPRQLRSWQAVDYFPAEQQDRSFERLLQSLRLRHESGAEIKNVLESEDITVKPFAPLPAPSASKFKNTFQDRIEDRDELSFLKHRIFYLLDAVNLICGVIFLFIQNEIDVVWALLVCIPLLLYQILRLIVHWRSNNLLRLGFFAFIILLDGIALGISLMEIL